MHFNRGDLAAIAVGGIAGAGLRWLITRRPQATGGWFEYAPNTSVSPAPAELIELGFPARTLAANVLGCLLLGALTVLLARAAPARPRLLLAAATGFCGSLTTFSTFAVEIAERLRGLSSTIPRSSVDPLAYGPEVGSAVSYLVVSIGGGALAFWLGRTIAQRSVHSPGEWTIGDGA